MLQKNLTLFGSAGIMKRRFNPSIFEHDIPRNSIYVCLSIVLCLAYWVRLQFWAVAGGFEPDYVNWATANYFGGITSKYVAIAHSISEWVFSPGAVYPPGYPALIALVGSLGATDLQVFRLVQIGLDSAACFLIYTVLRNLGTGRGAAVIGAAFYALAPWWVSGSTYILAEALVPALVLLLLTLLLRARRTQRMLDWSLCGFGATLLPLFRQELLPIVVPLAVWSFLVAEQRSRLKATVVTLGSFALPWLAIGIVNFLFQGEFRVTGHALYYNLFAGLGQIPNEYGYYVNDARARLTLQSLKIEPVTRESEQYWHDVYWGAWLRHPDYVLSTIFYRLRFIAFETDHGVAPFRSWSGAIALGPLIAIVASIILFLRQRYTCILLVWAPLITAWGTLGLIYVEVRYVRYASLTYLLSLALALDVLLAGLIRPIWRGPAAYLMRMVAIGLLTGISVVGILTYFQDILSLRSLANSAALSRGLAQLSSQLEDSAFEDMSNWQASVAGARVEVSRTGITRVFTSTELGGYQAMARVNTQRANSLTYRYELKAEGGLSFLGVLSGDGSIFRTQQMIKPGDSVRDRVTTRIDDESVSFVLSTSAAADSAKLVEFSSVRYALWCYGSTPRVGSSLVLRARYWFFPRSSDIAITTCPEVKLTPLGPDAWESVIAPARAEGNEVRLEGEPLAPMAYGAVSARYRLPKGTRVGAAGVVRRGGIVLGLLDAQSQWAATVAIGPGSFRTAVEAPADGKYRIVIANNLPAGEQVNDSEVSEIGLLGLDPAAQRVAPTADRLR